MEEEDAEETVSLAELSENWARSRGFCCSDTETRPPDKGEAFRPAVAINGDTRVTEGGAVDDAEAGSEDEGSGNGEAEAVPAGGSAEAGVRVIVSDEATEGGGTGGRGRAGVE